MCYHPTCSAVLHTLDPIEMDCANHLVIIKACSSNLFMIGLFTTPLKRQKKPLFPLSYDLIFLAPSLLYPLWLSPPRSFPRVGTAFAKGAFPPSQFSNKLVDKLAHKIASQTNVTHLCLVCQSEVCYKPNWFATNSPWQL
jgi:hypothetical protein